MNLKHNTLFRRIVQGLLAWQRGDVRVAPHGATGRVYEKKSDSQPAGRHVAQSRATAVLREIKVIRADGTEEIINPGA